MKNFFKDAKLHARRIEGELWRVQPEEVYLRTSPDLVTVDHIAAPRQQKPRFDWLSDVVKGEMQQPLPPGAEDELARRQTLVERTKDPVNALTFFQLQTALAKTSNLAETAETIYKTLAMMPRENDGLPAFSNVGVHLVRRDAALLHRAKIAAVWLRVEHDPKLAVGDFSHVQTALSGDGLVFAASDNLNNGVAVLDAYLGPLFGAMSPFVWAIPVTRFAGVLIYSLDQPLVGTRSSVAELLQLLPIQGTTESVPNVKLGAKSGSAAIEWWTGRLNHLFGILCDLGTYTDSSDQYVAAKHLQAMLTLEQVFRRVSSVQTTHRDTNARRVLLFNVLDTLEYLTGRPIEKNCDIVFARKTLEFLKQEIPEDAAEVLLPAANRAVTALENVQLGFFMQRQLGMPNVEYKRSFGDLKKLNPGEAAAKYIKILRNATHGHGANKSAQFDITNALLAHHDGSIPHDLASLGYLYLLDLLCKPDVLRRTLYRGGKV